VVGIYFEWGLFVLLIASLIIRFGFKKKPDAPILVRYAHELWAVFLVVFVIRAFIFQPFIVPSGSMLPTIQLGDFVFVNQLSYGVHLPFTGTVLLKTDEPKTGDIVVFKDPVNPQIDLIKTVIGVPGDTVSYVNKQLLINGKAVPMQFVQATTEPVNINLGSTAVQEYTNDLGGHIHHVYTSPNRPTQDFTDLIVLPGHYFCMGDNRDNSDDSRSWGFASEHDLIGKAEFIFLSYDSNTHAVRWHRIGMRLP
jgi:signal peptidase I